MVALERHLVAVETKRKRASLGVRAAQMLAYLLSAAMSPSSATSCRPREQRARACLLLAGCRRPGSCAARLDPARHHRL